MPAVIEVDSATERLRDVSLAVLAAVYILPLVWVLPPSVNVALTASLTVFSACLRTVGRTNEAELVSKKEAMKFPLIGSMSLVGLFVAIKFLPKQWLNYIITTYFCIMGVFALGELIYSSTSSRMPQKLHQIMIVDWKQGTVPVIMPEPADVQISLARLLCNLIALVFSTWYATSRHFLANNGMGLSYSIEGIAMLNLGSTQVGMILLWGLFFYDIFWVFFTPVMVTVAKNIDGPIKLLFPTSSAWDHFNMLGLGDIVIPGLFVSLMLRFDAKNGSGKVYFYAAMVGYTIGLAVTLVVMQTFKAAQPALLYIVPGVVGCVMIQAVIRGEMKELLSYTEEEEEVDDNVGDVAEQVAGAPEEVSTAVTSGGEEVKKDQ
eukprot:jgi/Ulvmu1/5632/UM023_0172.1